MEFEKACMQSIQTKRKDRSPMEAPIKALPQRLVEATATLLPSLRQSPVLSSGGMEKERTEKGCPEIVWDVPQVAHGFCNFLDSFSSTSIFLFLSDFLSLFPSLFFHSPCSLSLSAGLSVVS